MNGIEWDKTMLELAAHAVQPKYIVIPKTLSAMAILMKRSWDENWDRRRFKREARRAETSTYHKR